MSQGKGVRSSSNNSISSWKKYYASIYIGCPDSFKMILPKIK